jgi:hypothetical protein
MTLVVLAFVRNLAYNPIDAEFDLLTSLFQPLFVVVMMVWGGGAIKSAPGLRGLWGVAGSERMFPSLMGPAGGGG